MTTPLQCLQDCLTRQLHLARQFLYMLQEESELLADPAQTERLAVITSAKLACIQQFETLNDTRDQALAQLGLSPDSTSLEQAAQMHPVLTDIVAALRTVAAQARNLNTQNGIVIHSCLRHAQQALADLRQLASPRAEPLYNPAGRPTPLAPASRTVIKAG